MVTEDNTLKTFGGLLILFSFLVFVRSGFEFWRGTEDAWSTGVVGLFFLTLGYFLAVREPRRGVVKKAADAQEKQEPEAPAPVETAPDEASISDKAIFSVVQTGDHTVLDEVEALMAKDKRIVSIVTDSGRWYSVPDGDDLPEWFALRAYCSPELIDQVMEDTWNLMREMLGDKAANKVSISRYS